MAAAPPPEDWPPPEGLVSPSPSPSPTGSPRQPPEDWPPPGGLVSPSPSPPLSPREDVPATFSRGAMENVEMEEKEEEDDDDVEVVYEGAARSRYGDTQQQPTSNLILHPHLLTSDHQIDAFNPVLQNFFPQALRMPPPVDQGKQTSMVSRPSAASAASVQASDHHGYHHPQNHNSRMAPQSSSAPSGLGQLKHNGHANQMNSHPSFGPTFVTKMSSQPQPSSLQQPISHVGAMVNQQTSSWGNSNLDSMVNSSSSTPSQPRIFGQFNRRESSPFTISNDGVARVSSSEVPSKLAVVLGPNRSLSTSTQPKSLDTMQDPPLRYNHSTGFYSSLTARVEIPASTPEKLALKRYIPQPETMGKKRGRPFASHEAEEAAMVKAARKAARENGEYVEVKKKVGRPAKTNEHVDVPVPKPEYRIFYCEWEHCAAELHNAETLRKHLHSVHGKLDPVTKMITCRWKNCFQMVETEGAVTGIPSQGRGDMNFGSVDEWKAHLEVTHLFNVLRHQGDGPKSQDLSGNRENKTLRETDPWLFEANGKQVTPSVRNQGIDYGIAKETNAKRFKKRKEDLDIVYDLIENPEAYKKERKFEKDDDEEMY